MDEMRLGFPSAGLGFPSGWFGFPSGWLGFPSAQLGFPSVRPGNGSLRHSGAEVALGSPLVPAGGGRLGSYFSGFIPLQALDLEHSSGNFPFAHPTLPVGHPWARVRAPALSLSLYAADSGVATCSSGFLSAATAYRAATKDATNIRIAAKA
jgi:hypothetical protein